MKKDSAVVTINEAKIREHLGKLVRGSVVKEPGGGNLFDGIWRGPGLGNMPRLFSTASFPIGLAFLLSRGLLLPLCSVRPRKGVWRKR